MEVVIAQFTDIIRIIISSGSQWFMVFWSEFQSVFSPKDAVAFFESIGVLLTPALGLATGYFTKVSGLCGGKFKYGLIIGCVSGSLIFFVPKILDITNKDGTEIQSIKNIDSGKISEI